MGVMDLASLVFVALVVVLLAIFLKKDPAGEKVKSNTATSVSARSPVQAPHVDKANPDQTDKGVFTPPSTPLKKKHTDMVVVTKSGSKFHRSPNCTGLSNTDWRKVILLDYTDEKVKKGLKSAKIVREHLFENSMVSLHLAPNSPPAAMYAGLVYSLPQISPSSRVLHESERTLLPLGPRVLRPQRCKLRRRI